MIRTLRRRLDRLSAAAARADAQARHAVEHSRSRIGLTEPPTMTHEEWLKRLDRTS